MTMKTRLDRWDTLDKEHRHKVFAIPRRTLLQLIQGQFSIEVKGLPDDAILAEVSYEFYANHFAVRVYHESFPPVPPGERSPSLDDVWVHPAPMCIHGETCQECVADRDRDDGK